MTFSAERKRLFCPRVACVLHLILLFCSVKRMPVSWRATSWDWQLTSAWALCALMPLQRWVCAAPLSSVKIRKKESLCAENTDGCVYIVRWNLSLILSLPFPFLEPLTYSALVALWECEHICFDGCFTPAQTSHSCLQFILALPQVWEPCCFLHCCTVCDWAGHEYCHIVL